MTHAMAEEVSLFAAGSLTAALSEVAEDYTVAYGTPVATSFGPSGLMGERIKTGEVAHVFASSNMRHPRLIVFNDAPADAWKLAMHIPSPAGQSVLAEYGFDAAALQKED